MRNILRWRKPIVGKSKEGTAFDLNRQQLLFNKKEPNPYMNDVQEYFQKSLFPCLNAHLGSLAGNQAKLKLRLLWDHPWHVRAASTTIIEQSRIVPDEPEYFVGGHCSFQLIIDGCEISPKLFVLSVFWSNESGTLVSNLDEETFSTLWLMAHTGNEIPIRQTGMTTSTSPEPYDIAARARENNDRSELFESLKRDMYSAGKGWGWKKSDMDENKINTIISRNIESGKGTIENCIRDFLKSR